MQLISAIWRSGNRVSGIHSLALTVVLLVTGLRTILIPKYHLTLRCYFLEVAISFRCLLPQQPTQPVVRGRRYRCRRRGNRFIVIIATMCFELCFFFVCCTVGGVPTRLASGRTSEVSTTTCATRYKSNLFDARIYVAGHNFFAPIVIYYHLTNHTVLNTILHPYLILAESNIT